MYEQARRRLPRIWLVDDSALDAESARRALSPDFEICVLHDGSAVLERLAVEPAPDALVLDWVMPGITGIEVVRFLRTERRMVELPVLLLTGHQAPEQIAEGLAAGANDFVSKPFHAEELRARVQALLRSAGLLERAVLAERTVKSLLANSPDALLTIDGEGRVTFASFEAERVFERPAASMMGQELTALAPGLELGRVQVAPGEPPVTLPDVEIAARLFSPSVRVLPIDAAATTTILLRDVTERRRIERRRLDFYSIIAHDLRSPLQAMMVRADLILRGKRGPVSSELLGDVRIVAQNIRSMVALINDFLELARFEGTGYKLERSELDLCTIISSVVNDLAPLADATRQRISWHPPAEPLRVAGDRARLTQVVSNLIGNAIKFTPAEGGIALSAAERDSAVEVSITDTGPGIPADLIPKLFERFSRAPAQSAAIGSGLGLMIVREIVEAHGGTVGVDSTEGQGSRFWFRLPKLARARA